MYHRRGEVQRGSITGFPLEPLLEVGLWLDRVAEMAIGPRQGEVRRRGLGPVLGRLGIRLTDDEIEAQLATLPGWERADTKIHKVFAFKDFVAAFAFMGRVADLAEDRGHHPEWFNVYNTVEVWLTTHDASGLTARDFDLAAAMDEVA